jgi:prevent-host-death family protein
MKIISAGDANRHFSNVLRDVATGKVITVLSRGKPIATIPPVRYGSSERESAKRDLLERLRHQKASGARNWSRDELYEG